MYISSCWSCAATKSSKAFTLSSADWILRMFSSEKQMGRIAPKMKCPSLLPSMDRMPNSMSWR